MTRPLRSCIFCKPPAVSLALLLLTIAISQPAHAQTFKTLYSFTGGTDGRYPLSGVVVGPDGSLYGTTGGAWYNWDCIESGSGGCGTVFRLTQMQSGWNLSSLYSFRGGNDGIEPTRITIGPNGSLFGTTAWGGNCAQLSPYGCGTVFELTPSLGGNWTENVLYRFQGPPDAANPTNGAPVFDTAGNLYGTALGGEYLCDEGDACGAVYKLSYSGGNWNESIIWNFGGTEDDGNDPSNVIMDAAGNLYGTTLVGGALLGGAPMGDPGLGIAFQLVPSGASWTENVLHNFNIPLSLNAGIEPNGGLIFDQAGDLDGVTSYGWDNQGGTAYRLSHTDDGWNLDTFFAFPGGTDSGPYGSLVMDRVGNLYGVRNGTFARHGVIFKLTNNDGQWNYTELHDFGGDSEGIWVTPYLALDSDGNLYGTTDGGGAYGYGMVFEITP